MQDAKRLNWRWLAVRVLCLGLATLVVWAVFQLILIASGFPAWHRNWLIFVATVIVCAANFFLEGEHYIRVIAPTPKVWAMLNIGMLAIGAALAFI